MSVCSSWVFHIAGHRMPSKLFRADCVCWLWGLCRCAHVWVYVSVWARCIHAEADVFLSFLLHHSLKIKSFSLFFVFFSVMLMACEPRRAILLSQLPKSAIGITGMWPQLLTWVLGILTQLLMLAKESALTLIFLFITVRAVATALRKDVS